MVSKKRSPVWNFFHRRPDNVTTCLLCGRKVNSHGNTSNMFQHLKSSHHPQFIALKRGDVFTSEPTVERESVPVSEIALAGTSNGLADAAAPADGVRQSIRMRDIRSLICSEPSTSSAAEPRTVIMSHQSVTGLTDNGAPATSKRHSPRLNDDASTAASTIEPRHAKMAKHEEDEETSGPADNKGHELLDATKLTEAIAKFIATTCSVYSMVESQGFRQLMKVAAPNYEVPCRKMFSDQMIPELYVTMKEVAVQIISQAVNVALTTDVWTASDGRHFIGVTCSFVSDDWQLQTFALTCREADASHSGDNIKMLLEEVLSDFNIETSKVVAITTNRDLNMLTAVKMLNVTSVACLAHEVIAVVNAMLEHSTVKAAMTKVKQMYNIFAHSCNAKRFLAYIQKTHNVEKLQMPPSSRAEWWSELRQIAFVNEQKDALVQFLETYSAGQHKALILEQNEARLLKSIDPLLKRLQMFCDKLSLETEVTASSILKSAREIRQIMTVGIVTYQGQRDTANGIVTDHGIMELLVDMRSLASAFMRMPNAVHLNVATYLDLRFERTNVDASETAIRLDAPNVHESVPNVSPVVCEEKSFVDELFGGGDDDAATAADSGQKVPIDEEIERYRREPRIAYADNVLMWWKEHQPMYPLLAQVARKYLCISATCVASERVFSMGAGVLTKFRLPITEEHSDQMVFLAKNKHQLPMW